MLFAAVVAGFSLRAGSQPADLALNLATELAGVAFTVLVVDALSQHREMQRGKARLIREMGSDVRDVSVPAVEELRARGWLEDGSLQGAILRGARFDGDTTLPDETKWTPDTDDEAMRRFTDPEHPEYWRSGDPDSPVPRGQHRR